MKKWLVITLMMLGITACGEPEDPNAPTQAEKDTLTLAFINKIKKDSSGAVECKTKQVNNRYYVGCALISLDCRGNTYIFLYNKDKDPVKRFYALNGTAMTIYDNYFKNESLLGSYKDTFGLPMEKDIDLSLIQKSFEEK
ncbi:hypothetical protein MY909_01855 [Haemophilus influenzae]